MTFPATDCEKNVLARLGFGAAMPLPFEIAQYIHAACYAGLPGDGIATRVLRLLAWPKALKLIAEAFPLARLQDAELAEIRNAYLAGGSGKKFLLALADLLLGVSRYQKDAERIRSDCEDERRKQRRVAWEIALSQSPAPPDSLFLEELLFDFHLSGLGAEDVQRRLVEGASLRADLTSDLTPVEEPPTPPNGTAGPTTKK